MDTARSLVSGLGPIGAEVFATPQGWFARDRQSPTDTFVNGKPIGARPVKLGLQDVVRSGSLTLQVGKRSEGGYPAQAIDGFTIRAGTNRSWEESLQDLFLQTVTTLARAVELRDQYTGNHTQRVTDYALMLAEELQVTEAQRQQVRIGTPLHDIGKIGIRDAILQKPGKLTASEFEDMKAHTVRGAAMLEEIAGLADILPIVRHHHERWDGAGYPDRLAGQRISLLARIVAVADAFDAMTSDRPYRPALSFDQAFDEIADKSGSHFAPDCAEAFLRLRPRITAQTSCSRLDPESWSANSSTCCKRAGL